jgi:hypothetical protein
VAESVAKRLDCAGFSGAFGRDDRLGKTVAGARAKAGLKPPQSRRFAPSDCYREILILKTPADKNGLAV